MKVVHCFFIAVISAVVLALSGCALPVSSFGSTDDVKITVVTPGVPNPNQTTWSKPEPTTASATPLPSPSPTKASAEGTSEKSKSLETSIPVPAECEDLDAAVFFRFTQSQMTCEEILDLRQQLLDEVGEESITAALINYHEEYCTENGGNNHAEHLPYTSEPEGEVYKRPIQTQKPGPIDERSGVYDLGASIICKVAEKVKK